MNITKIGSYRFPSSLFDYDLESGNAYGISIDDNFLNIANKDENKEISFNTSSARFTYAQDGIRFSSYYESVGDGSAKITTVKNLDGEGLFVLSENDFDKDTMCLALMGFKIVSDNTIDALIQKDGDKYIISFQSNHVPKVIVSGDAVTLSYVDSDGNKVEKTLGDAFSENVVDFTIKTNYSIAEVISIITQSKSVCSLNNSVDSDRYMYQYDYENNVFQTIELSLLDEYVIDKYSNVMLKIANTTLCGNFNDIYDYENDRYFNSDITTFVSVTDGKINVVSKRVLKSLFVRIDEDGNTFYHYGFFESTHPLFASYAYVSTSYAYVKYNYSKNFDSCIKENNVDLELAVKFRIRKTGVTISSQNININLLHSDAEFGKAFLHSLKTGFGVFHNSLYNLKKYTSDGSVIKIKFNYSNSKNYYKITIEDQATRYKVKDEKHIDGDSTHTYLYYYYHYKYAEKKTKTTSSLLNFNIKKTYDSISDMDATKMYVGSLTVPPLTISKTNKFLNLNTLLDEYTIKSEKISVYTLARIVMAQDGEAIKYNAVYQPHTGTVYYLDVENNSTQNASDFENYFNNLKTIYSLQSTCDYAVLQYTDLDGVDKNMEFGISTLFLSEIVSGADVSYYRIYYVNANDIGYIEAKDYSIID